MRFEIRGAGASSHLGRDPYAVTPVEDGYQLTGGNTTTQAVLLGCLVVFWLVVSWVFVIIGVTTGGWPFALFGLLFVAVGIFMLVPLLRMIRVANAWGPATIVIDRWPLRIGESARCWFAQTSRGGAAPAEAVTASLTLRESATYRSGTDTRTATEDVVSIPLSVGPQDRNGRPGFSLSFEIPEDGPPTIELPRNRVEWLLLITASRANAPQADSLFGVRVSAEVMP
jgi:hypothetical protein